MRKAGRVAVVLAVVFYFAVPLNVFGRGTEDPLGGISLAKLIKTPVLVFKGIVTTRAKLERKVSSWVLHLGVDLFSHTLHRLSRDEAEAWNSRRPPVDLLVDRSEEGGDPLVT